MGKQSQSQELQQEKQSKFLRWIDERLVGPIITIILGAIIAGKIVIQITGVQFNIGIALLITLIIFIVMGISFFLGMGYLMLSFVGFFTKQKPPLIYRIVANIMHIVMLPFLWKYWRIANKTQQPPSTHQKQDGKDTQQ